MIISRISSGLGNQLFQYALGRNLALKQHTPLYVDLSYFQHEYDDDTIRKFKLSQFSIPYRLLQGSPVEYLSKATRLLPNRTLRPFFLFQKEKHYHFDPAVLTQHASCVILDGFWQSERYFLESAETIRKELQLSRVPSPEFDAYERQILAAPNAISLHVRRGDYVNHPVFSQTFGFVGLEYYQRALEHLASVHKDAQFFVFSDEKDWVKANVSLPGNPVYVETTGHTADVADLVLMSRCRHHVIANSSFSWWGAWLNPNPDKLVIYPKNWFRHQPTWDIKDLHPAAWLPL